MDQDHLIDVFVNPLAFLEADLPWGDLETRRPTIEDALRYLTPPGVSSKIEDLVARYKRISVESPRLAVAPAESRLLDRLIWPLRHAKGSFMLGNYLGTISLCGMVAEMSAILAFDLAKIEINNSPLTPEKQKALFGREFEKLGQEERTRILYAYGIIGDTTKAQFDALRTTRRKYLHLWSEDHGNLEKDAVSCFTNVVPIVVNTLGLDWNDGKLMLKNEVLEYLKRSGT